MVTIRTLITYALIAGTTHLGAMELSTKNDKESNESAWDILTDEVITKIAACCDPVSRNILMKVSSTLNYLASKRNKDIQLMHPLILGQWDRMHYMTVSCIKGKYHLLRNLLKNSINPNFIDYGLGVTPLFIAEQNKYNTLVNLLRKYGAIETLEVEKLSNTRLSMPSVFVQAVCCNEIDTVKKYLSEDINPNERILSTGATPLHIAIAKKYIHIVKLLLEHPDIQVNLKNNNDFPPLMLDDRFDIIKLLLEHSDIQVNLKANNEITKLMIAAAHDNLDIIEFLLAHPDIQVNLQTNNGITALIMAAYTGRFNSAKLLLTHPDIQVNLQTNNGKTALMSAVHEGHFNVVKLLLEYPGIQVDVQDEDGITALDIAKEKKYIEIIDLLQSYGNVQSGTGKEYAFNI